MCIASKLRIVNGRLNSEGAFTCFTPRGNSEVDYIIASESLFNSYHLKFLSRRSLSYSDHCPLSVNLRVNLGSEFCVNHHNKKERNLFAKVQLFQMFRSRRTKNINN